MRRSLTFVTVLWTSVLVLRLTGAVGEGRAVSIAAAQTQPAAPPSGYAGSDTCVLCHTTQEATLKGTGHGQAKNPRSPAAKLGCESCHGPGQAHVDDEAKGNMRKFRELKPAEINETCLSCHNRADHAGWEGSAHEARKLSCTTCHSVHSPRQSSIN